MANWKFDSSGRARNGLRLVGRSQLGFAPVVVPSPDPVSMAFNVAMGALTAISALAGRSGSEEANDLVQRYQNPLQNALGEISGHFVSAGDNATVEQLYRWANQVKQLGDEFYQRTLQYPNKGPGARRTILGVQSGNEWIQQPPDAPGYLTGLLNNILQHAKEAELRQSQMGFDWNSLIQGGFDLGGRIIDNFGGDDQIGPGGTPYYGPSGGGTQYYAPAGGQEQGLSTTTLIIGGLALFFLAPKLLKAFR